MLYLPFLPLYKAIKGMASKANIVIKLLKLNSEPKKLDKMVFKIIITLKMINGLIFSGLKQ